MGHLRKGSTPKTRKGYTASRAFFRVLTGLLQEYAFHQHHLDDPPFGVPTTGTTNPEPPFWASRCHWASRCQAWFLVSPSTVDSTAGYAVIMPRRLRIEFEGAIYHVMARGNARQKIVRDDADRRRLIGRPGAHGHPLRMGVARLRHHGQPSPLAAQDAPAQSRRGDAGLPLRLRDLDGPAAAGVRDTCSRGGTGPR